VWFIPTPIHASVLPYVNSGRFPDVRTTPDTGLSPLDCSRHDSPNFQPTPGGLAGLLTPIPPPADGFFEYTPYIGAVAPAPDDDWTKGWTAFPQN
jgi:hypothetical protein